MQLTAKAVAALQMPASKTRSHRVGRRASRLRLSPARGAGGKMLRSWIAQYRRAGGTRRITLGNAAGYLPSRPVRTPRRRSVAVAIGDDPQADRIDRRDKDQHGFRTVVAEYLKAKQPEVRARTHFELTRYLTVGYLKPLHGMPVDTVTRKDIAARLVAITRESGSITAARARAASTAFSSGRCRWASSSQSGDRLGPAEGLRRALARVRGRRGAGPSGAPAATTITAAACGS